MIHKDVLSRKLRYLLPARGTAEPFRRFLALPVGGASPEAVQTFLIHRGEGSCPRDHEGWGLTSARIPALRRGGSEMREVLGISDSQRDRKSQAGPPFLPALPTSWVAEPAAGSLES